MKLCVINLRGLGAGHAGPYGNRWIDTPSLDALASQGVVFDVHLAAHPDPDAARWCWRSGCHRFPGADAAEGWPDLLAVLRGAGVPTTLLADRSRPSPAAFEAGWDEARAADGLAVVIAAGREAIATLTGRDRGLVWIELASLLPPWDVADEFIDPYFTPSAPAEEDEDEEDEPDEEDELLEPLLDPPAGPIDPDDDLLFEVIQTTYAAAISQADAALADLLDGLPDDVAVLVTSDHGQALGERGFVGTGGAFLHREIVQVPLILRLAGRPLRRRVPELTLSVDIAPTIAELFGVELPDAHGRSLLPLAGLDGVPWRDYACLGGRAGDQVEWGMWTHDWALRLPRGGGEPRLYVRPDDRSEVNDVYQQHFETGEAMERTLRAYVASCERPGPLVSPPLEQPDTAAPSGAS